MANKYTKGKIYKITDAEYSVCYYGSTVEQLSSRMAKHRCNYLAYKQQRHHFVTVYTIFDKCGIDRCKIELVENYPCNSVEELKKKEGEYIKNNDCVNKVVPGRGKKEYYSDTRTERIQQHRDWYSNNREVQIQKQREHYQQHKQDILEKFKVYRDEHKDIFKERKQKYYLANKTKTRAHYNEKVMCDLCNCSVSRQNTHRHKQSDKHKHAEQRQSILKQLKEIGEEILKICDLIY